MLLAALHTHPMAILGDHVYPNLFYQAPLILGGNAKSSAAQVDWLVSQLKSARATEDRQRKLEERLLQAQKMESIGTLAGGIAHDFNNILNIIKGYAAVLNEELAEGRKTPEYFKVIDEAIERGAAMVRQLLTIARKTETHFAPTDINKQVAELANLVKETFPKTIKISTELDPNLPLVVADANQIGQVCLNLCLNARDAMPEVGSLAIKTSVVEGSRLADRHHEADSGTYIAVEIADTGKGIDETIRDKIFEPFFTTKREGEGTGLGLAMGDAVRLQYDPDLSKELLTQLMEELELSGEDLYPAKGFTAFTDLFQLYTAASVPRLKDRIQVPLSLPSFDRGADIWNTIRNGDVMIVHPYQSFDAVTHFVEEAAKDPKVLAIKMTLYRVSQNSPIVQALLRAAEAGKEVSVLVELQARFDEEANITWARALEEVGAHVVYGLVGYKTHCKACRGCGRPAKSGQSPGVTGNEELRLRTRP